MLKLHLAAPGAACTHFLALAQASVPGQGIVCSFCLPHLFTVAADMT